MKISSTDVTDPVDATDIKKIVYNKLNTDGSTTLTTLEGAELTNFLNNGLEVTIPANSAYVPEFKVYPQNDDTPEQTETVKMTIEKSPNDTNNSSAIDKPADTGTIIDDDQCKQTFTTTDYTCLTIGEKIGIMNIRQIKMLTEVKEHTISILKKKMI